MGIYLVVGDNPGKLGLIPHMSYGTKGASACKLSLPDEPTSDLLVGRVKAYQGDDR